MKRKLLDHSCLFFLNFLQHEVPDVYNVFSWVESRTVGLRENNKSMIS